MVGTKHSPYFQGFIIHWGWKGTVKNHDLIQGIFSDTGKVSTDIMGVNMKQR